MNASLRQRLISAAVSLPVVLTLIFLGPVSFVILLGLLVVIGGWELAGLLRRMSWVAPPFLPGAALAFFILAVLGLLGPWQLPLAVLGWILPLLWLFYPVMPRRRTSGPAAWLVHLLGALYLGLLLAYLGRLQEVPGGLRGAGGSGVGRVLFMLLVTWACDTGAYVTGSLFGRRRLWPAVSPKKTWEGALGGLLLTALAATALARPLAGLDWRTGLLLGALAGVVAQLGDLIESRLKRKAEVKDSGSLLPGHGGILDRLDSLLLVAPLFYYGLAGR